MNMPAEPIAISPARLTGGPGPDATAVDLGLPWTDGFGRLDGRFHTRLPAQPLPAPYWVAGNRALAREIGLDTAWLDRAEGAEAFAGSRPIAGTRPLASVYSGHQFGVWAGQLGDGRALLLGAVRTPAGDEVELQLKGSGRTPYSRMGDGRAVLRSSIREYLCSEAMHGLGIPTTRALALVGSDAPVIREAVETAAVVTRVAPSFIRFGHFEHFSFSGDIDALRVLADDVIDRFYPECREAAGGDGRAGKPYAALLRAVTLRTAALIAHWQAVGFCHGVMNTDNMSILGLTIDYGPFQFMDGFDPRHVCNHSDTLGRYAWGQQPNIAFWNLNCLAQALLPLIGDAQAALQALEPFRTAYPVAFAARLRAKLGLLQAQPDDQTRVGELLRLLAQSRADWTAFWRRLARHVAGDDLAPVRDLFVDRAAFDTWMLWFQERVSKQPRGPMAELMLRSNPAVVLRNHLAEQAIQRARQGDFSEIARLAAALARPFEEPMGQDDLTALPPDWAAQIAISCSS